MAKKHKAAALVLIEFIVLEVLSHNLERYEPDDIIELDIDQAIPLIHCNVIRHPNPVVSGAIELGEPVEVIA